MLSLNSFAVDDALGHPRVFNVNAAGRHGVVSAECFRKALYPVTPGRHRHQRTPGFHTDPSHAQSLTSDVVTMIDRGTPKTLKLVSFNV